MKPACKRALVREGLGQHLIGVRRACGLLQLNRASWSYRHRRREALVLRRRLREWAQARSRFGSLRLHRKEGVSVRLTRRRALAHAVQRQFPHGSRDHELHCMCDNECQPTPVSFMKTCATLGVTQAFMSYNNPKWYADTERLMRMLKDELLWLREWTSPLELERVLAAWVDWYNTRYVHSALGYRTPCQVEQKHRASHSTQSVAACLMGSTTW